GHPPNHAADRAEGPGFRAAADRPLRVGVGIRPRHRDADRHRVRARPRHLPRRDRAARPGLVRRRDLGSEPVEQHRVADRSLMARAERLTTTEIAVLGLLAWRELSGYELTRSIDNSVRFFWSPARSRVYEILPRRVEAGRPAARTAPGARGPDKTLYRATRAGKAELRRRLDAPTQPEPPRP